VIGWRPFLARVLNITKQVQNVQMRSLQKNPIFRLPSIKSGATCDNCLTDSDTAKFIPDLLSKAPLAEVGRSHYWRCSERRGSRAAHLQSRSIS
jgi:hypothetical protein